VDLAEIKEHSRKAWGLGDYSMLSAVLEPAAHELVAACGVAEGQRVLDVAAGDGNFALAVARRGASVVASDFSPEMVARGRARSEEEGLEVEWVEADAEDLPFEGDAFDCAGSVFGAFLAPRPKVAASELFRVVRPGGTVGMSNWTPDGFSGRMFEVTASYVPRPEGLPRPTDWGIEEIARERLGRHSESIEVERRVHRWELGSMDDFWELLERGAPAHVAVRSQLPPERYESLRQDLEALVEGFNRAEDGSIALDADYLLIVAQKRD
jgi:SAM-dependent methyltransferase